MKSLTSAIACILVFAVVSCGPPKGQVGGQAPEFAVTPVGKSGTSVTGSSLAGKVVLLDFWATWCGPCKMSMPELQSIYDTYKGRGVEVMGISNEEASAITRFQIDNPKFTYPMFLDAANSANLSFQVDSYPTTVVLGKNGKVIYRQAGYGPGEKENLIRAIEQGLKG
jgi:thiol-disulfide isomerase/thioredoxin